MRLWRICNARRALALDGEGARLFGGRWNSPGTAVVYASSTISLAVLETFVHFDPINQPNESVLISIEVPGKARIESIDPEKLPDNWLAYPAPRELAGVGDAWAKAMASLMLRVPSAVVPEEFNILLNPAHAGIRKCRAEVVRKFQYDQRMLKLKR